jgi:hypothetical protein
VEERGWTAECVVGCEVHSVADEAGIIDEIAGMKLASDVSKYRSTAY